MHRRTTRDAIAVGTAALLALTASACSQAAPEQAQTNLKIVGLAQVDANGVQVTTTGSDAPVDPAGDGKASCPPVSIAMAGAFTGPDTALGTNMKDGVQLAVDLHNHANPACQVQLKTFDTEDDPQKATEVAPQIIDDQSIVGMVGPQFSGETKATGSIFSQAGLLAMTPAATNVTLSQNGWRTFFRGLANDGVQGPSIANYLKNVMGAKKVCVIDDSTDYGLGIAQTVDQTLGPIAATDCKIEVKKGEKDFSATVTQLKSAAPDVIFYGGYYAEAAQLVQQSRDAGVTATFAAGDGSKDQEFVKLAGESARDTLFSCPCAPASSAFADDYSHRFGQEPGTYSTEAYDLGTILVKGVDSGAITREALLDFVRHYNGQGVARRYQWTPTGELTTNLIWIYKVQ
jgi:branched-chain amino acid transport system substrate-binding protein